MAYGGAYPYIDPVGADKNRNEPDRDTELLDGANIRAGGQSSKAGPTAGDPQGIVADVGWRGVGAANGAGRTLTSPYVIPNGEQRSPVAQGFRIDRVYVNQRMHGPMATHAHMRIHQRVG